MKRFLVAFTVTWFNVDGSEDSKDTRYAVEYATSPERAVLRSLEKAAEADKAYSTHNPDHYWRFSKLLFIERLTQWKVNALYYGYNISVWMYHYCKKCYRTSADESFASKRDMYGEASNALGKILDSIEAV